MLYLVSHSRCVIGIFTNRTWMMNKIGHLVKDYYIKGVRHSVEVTAASIGAQMRNGYLPLYSKADDKIKIRIWKLSENNINPQFKEINDV